MSAGWHCNSLQMASNVEKRIALAFPVFRMERLAGVMSIFSDNSFSEIFRFAIMTSKFTIIAIVSDVLDGKLLFFSQLVGDIQYLCKQQDDDRDRDMFGRNRFVERITGWYKGFQTIDGQIVVQQSREVEQQHVER